MVYVEKRPGDNCCHMDGIDENPWKKHLKKHKQICGGLKNELIRLLFIEEINYVE